MTKRNFAYKIDRFRNIIDTPYTQVNGIEYANITACVDNKELLSLCHKHITNVSIMTETGRERIAAFFSDFIQSNDLMLNSKNKPFLIHYNGQDIQVYVLKEYEYDVKELA